jgi:Mg-chelatase subunit ChlD/uncharacterized membrane protein
VIGLSVTRPELLWLLLLVPVLVAGWLLWPPPLTRGRSRFSLALRLALVFLLVLTIAGTRFTLQPQRRAVIAVVDLSASTRSGLDAETAAVHSLIAKKRPDDLVGVVTFGHDAEVEVPPSRDPNFDVFQTQPDPNYTDISSALRLAGGLIPDGYARQIVLITDGRQNLGDAAGVVAALRTQGVRVDIWPVGDTPQFEALVLAVDAPAELRAGQASTVTVRLRSTSQAMGKLMVQLDGKEVAVRELTLAPGVSSQSFNLPAQDAGLHKVRAELSVQPDTYSQNNVGEAAIRVLGQPLVLVLEGTPGEGANIVSALEAAGMKVERRLAAQAPTDTATIGRYDSIVVVDAPADQLPRDAMVAIQGAVHDLGRGLVTVGGPNAYGPGGWKDTPLEQSLPVLMDLPNRKEKPKVAVVLVMETMESAAADQVALGAAEAVIDKLTSDDQVAVTDGRSGGFLIEMQPVKDKKALFAKLEGAVLGDPPSYAPYIQNGGQALLKTDAPLKHIIVLGDGDAIDSSGTLQNDLQSLKGQGVTTSAIGVNTHNSRTFMATMQDIARWGGGSYYESNDPSQVPQLLLKESQRALRPWFETTPFFPKITSAGDLLQGIPLDAFPELGGYVVTTSKPSSEVYFSSPKQDPVLAAWSYGLGRSVAWTPDAKGIWTAGFLKSDVSGALFTRMVAWTLPGEGPNKLQVETSLSGDGVDVVVVSPDASDGSLQLNVVSPDLEAKTVDMSAVSPGRWQGRIPATTTGTYLLHASLKKGGSVQGQADAAVSVPYSLEYLQLGRDGNFLKELTRLGGGTILAKPENAWTQRVFPIPISAEIFWWLLLAVAILWPLDVAVRRLTLSPMQLGGLVRDVVTFRRPRDVEVAVPAELERLRTRVAPFRRRRVEAGVITADEEAAPVAISAEKAEKVETEAPAASRGSKGETDQDLEAALSARLLAARRRRRGKGD